MRGLTTELLSRACRIFMALAYPEGESTAPALRRPFFAISTDQPLAAILEIANVCEKLLSPDGRLRGYAFRLGSAHFPHLKLQVATLDLDEGGAFVFAVDTHDALRCTISDGEREIWAQIQAANRRLKEHIEQEWEKHGLLTFNGVLRRGLGQK
jgi:hypothetical protein